MKKIFDLRSDTVTLPSEGMREAIYRAEVGDDVFKEDRTINRLQDMAKEITGKEDSLFVSSGCMGNLIALMIHGGRGKEVLCAKESHIIAHEIGAVSSLAGTLPIEVPSVNGIIEEDKLEEYIKPISYDLGLSSIIEVENTTSGLVYPLSKLKAIEKIAKKHNMAIHLDGARIFNASVESGVSVKEYASTADDITFCLSKGLGAPVGSLLSGDKEFISQARRIRKLLGGGMRQAGFLAAAGIYALEHNVERLKEDHQHAKAIKEALEKTSYAKVKSYGTNMLFFTTPNYDINAIVKRFNSDGLLVLSEGNACRIVTNLNIRDEDTLAIIRYIENFSPEGAK